jgi:cell wall-associated NlpC family hydrolase
MYSKLVGVPMTKRPIAKTMALAILLVVSLCGLAGALGAHPAGAATRGGALVPAATQGDAIVAAAASQAGVPYCDGGGTINGPSNGGVVEAGCGPGVKGFDCMSVAQYAVYQVTGIALPSDGSQLAGVGTFIAPTDTADLLPGDVTYWGGTLDHFAHSGIYAGNDEVWDAVGIGIPVQLHTMTYLEGTYSYDGAIRYWTSSSTPTPTPTPPLTPGGLTGPVVGMAASPDGTGYWLTNAAGDISAHGMAVSYGSLAGTTLQAPITHIIATPSGKGYWLVAKDGGIFTFGDAGFFGSMGGKELNAPVVDMAPTADGKGYWLVASDGGVFAFGDAVFQGSMGAVHLNKPVVGIAADDATGGYWLVASDGGIFTFGAPFYGSAGNLALAKPVNGMAPTADDRGYVFVASDGGIFAFGDAKFLGSEGAATLDAPIVGTAFDNSSGGYWLVGSDGGIFTFNAPFYGAD